MLLMDTIVVGYDFGFKMGWPFAYVSTATRCAASRRPRRIDLLGYDRPFPATGEGPQAGWFGSGQKKL